MEILRINNNKAFKVVHYLDKIVNKLNNNKLDNNLDNNLDNLEAQVYLDNKHKHLNNLNLEDYLEINNNKVSE